MLVLSVALAAVGEEPGAGGDWPRWRGPFGDGTWDPQDLPEGWTTAEPRLLWNVAVGGGYGGVTVAAGRVYLMDRPAPGDEERVLCLDLKGKTQWEHRWEADYGGMDYGTGPRASVTLHEGNAFVLGATGMAWCLDAGTGSVKWGVNTVEEHGARVPTWGFAASPLVDANRVLLHVGAQPNGSVLALDQATGRLLWRGGADPAGYCTPQVIEHAGRRQLIVWGPEHVQSLDPETGSSLWMFPYKMTYGVSIAQPAFHAGVLVVSGYWHGTRALQLSTRGAPAAKLLWQEEKRMCGLMSAPLLREGVLYLLDKTTGLQAVDHVSGRILWSDDNSLTPKDRNPQMSLVWVDSSKGLAALLNASGELVYVELKPEGFKELARHQIIGKTWAHPAFAGNLILARSDSELVAWQLW